MIIIIVLFLFYVVFLSLYVVSGVFLLFIYIFVAYLFAWETVLNRCISGLPSTQCPYIPKKIIQQYKIRHVRDTHSTFDIDITNRNETRHNFPYALQQVAVQEPQCEEKRLLGQEILLEKGHHVDSMLSRFVGNFISHISGESESQKVSAISHLCILYNP